MFFLLMTEILLRNYRFWRLDWEAIFEGQSKTRISNQFSRIILARIGSRLKFLIEKTYAFWLIFMVSNIKYRIWNLSLSQKIISKQKTIRKILGIQPMTKSNLTARNLSVQLVYMTFVSSNFDEPRLLSVRSIDKKVNLRTFTVLFVKQRNWQLLILVFVISKLTGLMNMVRSVSREPIRVMRSNALSLFRRDS